MNTEALLEKTVVEPESLIGTKWTGWSEMFCDRMMIEFVDKKNCIYTSKPKEYTISYTVTGGQIFIGNIEAPFELRGNVLFNSDLPAFQKVT